jgi:group I intron endonuclease
VFVYLVTNKINGKQYVGQTKNTPEQRWAGHVYSARGDKSRRNYPLYHAIRKYGPESFCVATLDVAQSQEELNQKEFDFIAAYNTTDKDFGYNRHEGGGAHLVSTATPASRLKAAASNRGQKRSAVTCQRISEANKRRFRAFPVTPEMRKQFSVNGHRTHELHADLQAANGRAQGIRNIATGHIQALGRINGRKCRDNKTGMFALPADQLREIGTRALSVARHVRWHVQREIVSSACAHCRANSNLQ